MDENGAGTSKPVREVLREGLVSMEELVAYINGTVNEIVGLGSIARVDANRLLRQVQQEREKLASEDPTPQDEGYGDFQSLPPNVQLLAVKLALLDRVTEDIQKAHRELIETYMSTRRALFTQLEAEHDGMEFKVNFSAGAFAMKKMSGDHNDCNCLACQFKRRLKSNPSAKDAADISVSALKEMIGELSESLKGDKREDRDKPSEK